MVDDLYETIVPGHGADASGVVLRVHLQPGAGRSAVVGRHGDALKVRVAVPPERGRANDAAAALLAATFGVPAGSVELVSGAGSRSKRFALRGVEPGAFRAALERVVGEADRGNAGPGPGVLRPSRT